MPRTNLFLAASLLSAGVPHPVRIRDLSSSGARIETFLVPEKGAELTLVRGRLSAVCNVTWSAEHFCGLRFCSPVSVNEWMTHPAGLERGQADPGSTADGRDDPETAASREAERLGRIARDLGRVIRLLARLGETLAGDPHVVVKHGPTLHNLGLAMQTLATLTETMQASARKGAETLPRAQSPAAR